MNEIPQEYLCPISFDIMNDTVICSDGHTYERTMILNIPNSFSPLTREPIDLTKLIPNRNLKDAIERYKLLQNNNSVLFNKKLSNMSKLEQYEHDQKIKNQELQNKINNECLEKKKREKEEHDKKQKEVQDNIKLNRILEMFNSQNTALFNYGNFSSSNNSMNQWRNISYSYSECGKHKYIFTIEMLKIIKNDNKELLSEKYNKLVNDYIWVKKYVFVEGTNPLVEFVFDEFIPEIDNLLEKESKNIEENEKTDKYAYSRTNGYLEKQQKLLMEKVKLLKKIKNTELKSKEFYIVNYDNFCTDFNIQQINYDTLNNKFNILQFWIHTKQRMFNTLIENIFNIYNNDKINFVKFESSGAYSGGQYSKEMCNIHILEMYKKVIQSSTQISYIQELYQNPSDLVNDYEPKFFEPLIILTKNIIELIDFL
jgi:hypothetical protein